MKPLSIKQLATCLLIYLAVAAAGTWFLAANELPELAPAALSAQAFVAAGLFLWYRVDERIWRPYVLPAVLLAGAAVLGPAYYARKAPWAMTPSFLAPELAASDFASLNSRTNKKVRFTGRVIWWDEYPFGTGLVDPVKLRVEDETGAVDVIVDRVILDRDLKTGQDVRMIGRVRRWEGYVVRFVALTVTFLDPGPREED